MFYRQAWEEINLDHLDHNLDIINDKLDDKALIAVIKANAYGVGDYQVALCAIAHNAKYLAVSSLDEAISLRNKNITCPILVLNYVSAQHLFAVIKHDITITVTSLDHAQKIKASLVTNLKLHIKIDTGMNRIGFKNIEDIKEALALLSDENNIEGIFTHYLDSGNSDDKTTLSQYQQFSNIINELNFDFKYIHLANSDAIIGFDDSISNAARAGIALFGISSFNSDLKPVCSFYTKITHIKQVTADDTISYGGTYQAKDNEWIATIPIGYADGLDRRNQDQYVFVNGYLAKIVGRICMDMCMISLPKYEPIDTIVEIFGQNIPIEDVAKRIDTIPYEVLTSISDRISRVYKRKFKIVEIDNPRLEK